MNSFMLGEIAVNCKTHEEARKLLRLLHKRKIKWGGKTSLMLKTLWGEYGRDTCYQIYDGGLFVVHKYQLNHEPGVVAIPFTEFIQTIHDDIY